MTKEKKIYRNLNYNNISGYLDKEVRFINENYSYLEGFFRKISFFKHIFYWQVIFKLQRGISVALSQKLHFPYYIHENKLEIELTTDCNMKCCHCDRSCPQAYSNDCMSVDQIKHFISESVQANKKWPFIVLIGGEPTLHPNIFEICELFIEYKRKFSPNTKITISTNGVSAKTQDVLKRLSYIIHPENSSKTTSRQVHFDTFNVAPIDLEKYKNTRVNFAKGCCIPSLAGTALTKYGFYPCGAGAGIDRVTGLDIGIRRIKDRTEPSFRNQLVSLCKYCGHFKNNKEDVFSLDYISPTWAQIYRKYADKKPVLTMMPEAETGSLSAETQTSSQSNKTWEKGLLR